MSWYVEHLLLNAEVIKTSCAIEDSEYEDLLDVERALEEVEIKEAERNLMYLIIGASSILDAEEREGKNCRYYYNTFTKVCQLIADNLGGIFLDEGYLNHLEEVCVLTSEQLETIRRFMQSKYRHKLLTKPFKG